MKLIDKDRIAAEIEGIYQETNYEPFTDEVLGKRNVCRKMLDFFNTIETKDADLEKELKILDNTLFDLDGVAIAGATHYLTVEDVKDIAKRFYEMGLNARKGE